MMIINRRYPQNLGGANQIGRGGADRPDFTKWPENIAGRGVNGK